MSIIEKLQSNVAGWLEERLKISVLQKVIDKKVVPQHEQSFWYYFGGIALFLFIVQIITGLLLMVYYQPGVETSHASVEFITKKAEFGWLIRSIHSWSANLMIGTVFIHMFCAYFMKAFRKPRELTWLTGFGLFVMTLGLGFSGYLLPWDKLSFFATKIGLQIMEITPVVGPELASLLRGGDALGNATISRFFELHVVILPLAIMGLLGLHLLLVQIHGMSTPHSYANKPARLRKSIPFFTDFLYHDLFIWSVLMGVLVVVAATHPWELGEKADPFAAAPEGIKPEWYFMFMYQALKFMPAHIGPFEGELVGILIFMVAGALWALVPFWEGLNKFTAKLGTFYGFLAVGVIVGMTFLGYFQLPEDPLGGKGDTPSITTVSSQAGGNGAALFKQSCAACHSIGGGKLVGPDLKEVIQKRDKESLSQFILNPQGSAMPKIEGLDKESAMAILNYVEAQANPQKSKAQTTASQAQSVSQASITPLDTENGYKLFAGMKPFTKGGPACIACHTTAAVGTLGGGTLGPNLTAVYQKLGEQKGLEGWLSAIPSPTMKPAYKDHELSPAEIHALVAYLGEVSKKKAPSVSKETHYQFPLFGGIGALLALLIIAILYNNRFRSVRQVLVHGKESEESNEKGV